MIKKVDLAVKSGEVFGNPAPMGLMGLAIACFAALPLFFASGKTTPETLRTAAMYTLLFGGGCQFLTGLMDFANKNHFGGAIFTTFSFLNFKNGWELMLMSKGVMPDHSILITVEVLLLAVFLVLTYGFGFFSRTLFIFLVDIDLLFVLKVIKGFTHSHALDMPIGVVTALLGLIALWLAFGALINPVSGRDIFKDAGPVFVKRLNKKTFDFTLRNSIFEILYNYWKENAFGYMKVDELEDRLKDKLKDSALLPELYYLTDYGCMAAVYEGENQEKITKVRLNSRGIDLYEQLILKKYEF